MINFMIFLSCLFAVVSMLMFLNVIRMIVFPPGWKQARRERIREAKRSITLGHRYLRVRDGLLCLEVTYENILGENQVGRYFYQWCMRWTCVKENELTLTFRTPLLRFRPSRKEQTQ